jgi:hypothetical protein
MRVMREIAHKVLLASGDRSARLNLVELEQTLAFFCKPRWRRYTRLSSSMAQVFEIQPWINLL